MTVSGLRSGPPRSPHLHVWLSCWCSDSRLESRQFKVQFNSTFYHSSFVDFTLGTLATFCSLGHASGDQPPGALHLPFLPLDKLLGGGGNFLLLIIQITTQMSPSRVVSHHPRESSSPSHYPHTLATFTFFAAFIWNENCSIGLFVRIFIIWLPSLNASSVLWGSQAVLFTAVSLILRKMSAQGHCSGKIWYLTTCQIYLNGNEDENPFVKCFNYMLFHKHPLSSFSQFGWQLVIPVAPMALFSSWNLCYHLDWKCWSE